MKHSTVLFLFLAVFCLCIAAAESDPSYLCPQGTEYVDCETVCSSDPVCVENGIEVPDELCAGQTVPKVAECPEYSFKCKLETTDGESTTTTYRDCEEIFTTCPFVEPEGSTVSVVCAAYDKVKDEYTEDKTKCTADQEPVSECTYKWVCYVNSEVVDCADDANNFEKQIKRVEETQTTNIVLSRNVECDASRNDKHVENVDSKECNEAGTMPTPLIEAVAVAQESVFHCATLDSPTDFSQPCPTQMDIDAQLTFCSGADEAVVPQKCVTPYKASFFDKDVFVEEPCAIDNSLKCTKYELTCVNTFKGEESKEPFNLSETSDEDDEEISAAQCILQHPICPACSAEDIPLISDWSVTEIKFTVNCYVYDEKQVKTLITPDEKQYSLCLRSANISPSEDPKNIVTKTSDCPTFTNCAYYKCDITTPEPVASVVTFTPYTAKDPQTAEIISATFSSSTVKFLVSDDDDAEQYLPATNNINVPSFAVVISETFYNEWKTANTEDPAPKIILTFTQTIDGVPQNDKIEVTFAKVQASTSQPVVYFIQVVATDLTILSSNSAFTEILTDATKLYPLDVTLTVSYDNPAEKPSEKLLVETKILSTLISKDATLAPKEGSTEPVAEYTIDKCYTDADLVCKLSTFQPCVGEVQNRPIKCFLIGVEQSDLTECEEVTTLKKPKTTCDPTNCPAFEWTTSETISDEDDSDYGEEMTIDDMFVASEKSTISAKWVNPPEFTEEDPWDLVVCIHTPDSTAPEGSEVPCVRVPSLTQPKLTKNTAEFKVSFDTLPLSSEFSVQAVYGKSTFKHMLEEESSSEGTEVLEIEKRGLITDRCTIGDFPCENGSCFFNSTSTQYQCLCSAAFSGKTCNQCYIKPEEIDPKAKPVCENAGQIKQDDPSNGQFDDDQCRCACPRAFSGATCGCKANYVALRFSQKLDLTGTTEAKWLKQLLAELSADSGINPAVMNVAEYKLDVAPADFNATHYNYVIFGLEACKHTPAQFTLFNQFALLAPTEYTQQELNQTWTAYVARTDHKLPATQQAGTTTFTQSVYDPTDSTSTSPFPGDPAPSKDDTSKKDGNTELIVALVIIGVLIVIAAIVIVCCCCLGKNNKNKAFGGSQDSENEMLDLV